MVRVGAPPLVVVIVVLLVACLLDNFTPPSPSSSSFGVAAAESRLSRESLLLSSRVRAKEQEKEKEPQPSVRMPKDDPSSPRYDLKKEKRHVIAPDIDTDNVHLENYIRVTVDHNLREKLRLEEPNNMETMKEHARDLAYVPEIEEQQRYRFKAVVPADHIMRFRSKECNIPTPQKVSAMRNVNHWPSWMREKSIEENVRLQRSACLDNDYASSGGFCFNEKDLDGPWCYWPKLDCEILEKRRRGAAHLVADYPAYGSSKQKEACSESGFCYETGARPACYLPKV